MGGHATDDPCDGCARKVEFGLLIGVGTSANHSRFVPTGGTKSGLERFAGRDRDGLEGTLNNVGWARQFN